MHGATKWRVVFGIICNFQNENHHRTGRYDKNSIVELCQTRLAYCFNYHFHLLIIILLIIFIACHVRKCPFHGLSLGMSHTSRIFVSLTQRTLRFR